MTHVLQDELQQLLRKSGILNVIFGRIHSYLECFFCHFRPGLKGEATRVAFFNDSVSTHRRIQGTHPPPPSPNCNVTDDKNVTKIYCFFSFSFF